MFLIDFIKNIDDYIGRMIVQFGPWTYLILFLIVFAETGLVFMPFLPGDSLLLAAGIFSNPNRQGLDLKILLPVLTLAPLVGDSVNYHVGKWLGPRLFRSETSRFLNRKHLAKTEEFFVKHGAKTIIIARWVPIVRTFAPFVAGMGAMEYKRFFGYSVLGAFIWVWTCVLVGYYFGQIKWVEDNFEYAILAIIAVSLLPILFEAIKHRREAKQRAEATATTL
jgi:membrane-associated protein